MENAISVENDVNSDLLKLLAKDLCIPNLDQTIINAQMYGPIEAARILGSDTSHYDNFRLAGKLVIHDQKSKSPKTLRDYVAKMRGRMGKKYRNFILDNSLELEELLQKYEYLNDDYDWFSVMTIVSSYSAKTHFKEDPVETPLLLWLRCAVQFQYPNLERVKECFVELTEGYYTPSSPEMFNAAEKKRFRQMSSCFLINTSDNTDSIAETIKNSMFISKGNGGIGINVGNIRHSNIRDVGDSSGVIPFLMILNYTARMFNQNGKRKAAITTFIPIYHLDVREFMEISLNTGDPSVRGKDINTCLWLNWLFMNRVRTNAKWTLFCPAKTKELSKLSGVEFARKYIEYENDPTITYKNEVDALQLFKYAQASQVGSGMPYMMQGDACNIKSNHRHLGKHNSSNLCLEILEYADDDNLPSCNLHSLSMVKYAKSKISPLNFNLSEDEVVTQIVENVDFEKLATISRNVVSNLNNIIDVNVSPLDTFDESGNLIPGKINLTNKRQRPLAIGVSGFAEMLHTLDIPFECNYTTMLNKMFFACVYWNCIVKSIQLAILDGECEIFKGSPMSEGKLQFDLWAEEFNMLSENEDLFGPVKHRTKEEDIPIEPSVWGQKSFDLVDKYGNVLETVLPTWESLKSCMVRYGMRNSLLTSLMPTASSAQIRRNCESFEAHQTNLYSRKVLNSNSTVMNRFMVYDLDEINAWNSHTVDYLSATQGSLNKFTNYIKSNKDKYPNVTNYERCAYLELKYKTMWEISQKHMINLNAARGRYVDQSSSFNLYISDANATKIEASLVYANAVGLKTLVYYLRQRGASIGNIITDNKLKTEIAKTKVIMECTDEVCTACSS